MPIGYDKEDHIVVLTIDRPEAKNAFDPDLMRRLSEAFVRFKGDNSAWVAILTGVGDAFCAGGDIRTLFPYLRDNILGGTPWALPPLHVREIELWKPIIAAVNGIAFGGGTEIALACDIRIASETAKFALPEVRWSIIPGWGGTQRLPRVINWASAAEMLLTGLPIDAQEAYRIGLVSRVVAFAELMPTAKEIARTICEAGQQAVRAAKEAMIRGTSLTLDDGLRLESALATKIMASRDFEEAIAAFTEKRKPQYTGK